MKPFDLCIYGATSCGVVAAVAAARAGLDVLLVEPGRHLGGMSSGGLGATDFGNKQVIGGLARQFYQRLGQVYGREEAWTFEPAVAERTFEEMVAESSVVVRRGYRVVAAHKSGRRIERATFEQVPTDAINAPVAFPESGAARVDVVAKVFIDATYEGDLMALAGVGYTVGREPCDRYGESHNGIRPHTPKHQFLVPVDPYVRPGDPLSGTLPLIQPGNGGTPGRGDRRVQAYNFRLCLTQNPANRLPIDAPAGYDADRYRLLGRYLQALEAADVPLRLHRLLMAITPMPNGKTDLNNSGGFSTDYIGANWDYPDADYARRGEIWHDHLAYTQGFLHYLATDPAVPAALRDEMGRWGLCRDEFADTGGWPHQLYVREARRMVGAIVVTQADCEHHRLCPDPIGMAAYTMDSHNCQRVVQDGVVRNEGNVEVHPTGPYPIAYGAITPRPGECDNLLVPVCLSASHIAYGSIRMEPVFMVLGESAAIAAGLAIENDCAVQAVAVDQLTDRLLAAGQVLSYVPDGRPRECGNPVAETVP